MEDAKRWFGFAKGSKSFAVNNGLSLKGLGRYQRSIFIRSLVTFVCSSRDVWQRMVGVSNRGKIV